MRSQWKMESAAKGSIVTRRRVGFGMAVVSAVMVVAGTQESVFGANYVANNAAATATWSTIAWTDGSQAVSTPVSSAENAISISNTSASNVTSTHNLGALFKLNQLSVTNASGGGGKSMIIDGTGTFDFVKNAANVNPTLLLSNTTASSVHNIQAGSRVSDPLTVTKSGQGPSVIQGSISNVAGITFDGTGTGALTLGFNTGTIISGAGGLTLNSTTYTVALSGPESYTGATVINTGASLQLGNNNTVGSLSTSSAITNDGSLKFRRTNTITQGTDFGAIAGSGSVIQLGSGTVVLASNNTYSGGTTLVTGTTKTGNANALGTGAVRLSPNSSALLQLDTSDLTVASLSSDSITTPTVTGGGANFTQATTIVQVSAPNVAGGVQATATATVTSGAVSSITITNYGSGYTSPPTFTVLDTDAGSETAAVITPVNQASSVNLGVRTLTIAGTNTVPATYTGVISGTGGLIKNGNGSQTLAGVNTYTGDTTVNAGAFTLADDGGMKFVVGASGVNNKIAGSGTVVLNGDFTFDLASAGASLNDTWTIVGVPGASFGSSFSVVGFDDANLDNVWTLPIANTSLEYRFSESTGVLSVQAVPEPASLGLLGLGALLAGRRRARIG